MLCSLMDLQSSPTFRMAFLRFLGHGLQYAEELLPFFELLRTDLSPAGISYTTLHKVAQLWLAYVLLASIQSDESW